MTNVKDLLKSIKNLIIVINKELPVDEVNILDNVATQKYYA